MKKIFLTSGIIVCMACPAFADFDANLYNHEPGEQPELTQTGACEQDHLGVTSGSTILKAIWTSNRGEVRLNNNSSYTPVNCGDNPQDVNHSSTDQGWASIFTAATSGTGNNAITNITTLYTTYGVGVYPDSATQTADTTDAGTGAITSLTTVPTLTGYEFGGYYTQANGEGTQKIDENGDIDSSVMNLVTTNGDYTTLYAKWTPKHYTVNYNCGVLADNTAVAKHVNSSSFTYDDCYSLEAITDVCGPETSAGSGTYKVPTGYTFGGWQCVKTTTVDNPSQESFILPGASTFKTLPGSNQDDLVGYPSGITAGTLYRDGAAGVWTTALADNESVTCTAIWRANNISITWNGDGAENWTPTGATPSCTYDSNVVLPTAPAKTGYTFGGWEVVHPTPEECAANPSTEGCQQQNND